MDTPEKIYVHEASAQELTENLPYHVEYTRTDFFVEKAVEWLRKSLDNGCWVSNDVGEQEKEAIIEHFKETMSDENYND